jgi:pimeloyl-ACP methyl ester carboxylesterase
MLSRFVAFAVEWLRTPIHTWIYNPDNVERGIAGASMMTIQDVPAALSLDFARFAALGGPIEALGGSVADRLEGLRIPVLFFCGTADRLAPPDAVQAAFDMWGRKHDGIAKRIVVLGRAHGALADYGHGDLAIGRNVKEDVFVPAAEFLRGA